MYKRVITGVALALGVAIILYIDITIITWAILGATFIVASLEAIELFNIKEHKRDILIINILSWVLLFFIDKIFVIPILFILLIAGIYAFNKKISLGIIKPILYPTFGFMAIYYVYLDGVTTIIWLILAVSLTDTGAYFVGKSIGNKQLTPTSPNKTVEGALGGLVISTLISTIYSLVFLDLPFYMLLLGSVAMSITSIFGDLFESYLKREAGVKDSGNILPGHGGILDRLDGFLFSAIILATILIN